MKKKHAEHEAHDTGTPGPMQRQPSGDGKQCRVSFWLPRQAAPDAATVAVAGSFNDWSLDRHPMLKSKDGDYRLELDLEAGKEHQFRFVIDGVRWENAWNADRYVWSDLARCDNSVVAT